MKTFFFLLCLLATLSAGAQAFVPTTKVGNSSLTNSLIVRPVPSTMTTAPLKLYAVTGQNLTNAVVYVQIFETTTNQTNGSIPTFSYPVPANANGSSGYYFIDFGFYGVNLDGAVVEMSTTATNLTLAPPTQTIQAVYKNP